MGSHNRNSTTYTNDGGIFQAPRGHRLEHVRRSQEITARFPGVAEETLPTNAKRAVSGCGGYFFALVSGTGILYWYLVWVFGTGIGGIFALQCAGP